MPGWGVTRAIAPRYGGKEDIRKVGSVGGEVQGELQREMGLVRSDLQHLGPLEKNMGVLLEKMEILDQVKQSL